jgi:tyrosine-protein kinase Etk/Wzc
MGPVQSFAEFTAFLRRRIDIIALVIGLGILGSIFFALASVPTYQAHAVLSARLNTVSGEFATNTGAENAPARLLQLVEQRLTTRENMLALADKYDMFREKTVLERVDNMRMSITFLSQAAITIGFASDGVLSSIVIQARADTPEKAAEIANELAELTITQTGAGREARARETLSYLQQQQITLQQQISAIQQEARDFANANTDAMPFNVEIRRAELLQIGAAIQAAESAVATLEASLGTLSTQGSTQRRLIQTRTELAARVAELERLQAQRTELEPFFVRMAAVEREMASFDDRERRARDSLRDLSNEVAMAEANLRLETAQQIAAYEIVETAAAPDYPISRSRKTLVLLGTVAMSALAVFGAFVWEVIRPALRSAGQVERETGMRPVLVLPELVTPLERRKILVARLAGLSLFGLGILAAVLMRLSQ